MFSRRWAMKHPSHHVSAARQELCVCVICEALRIPQPTASSICIGFGKPGSTMPANIVMVLLPHQRSICGIPMLECLKKLWACSRQNAEDIRRLN
jgi:hypothetical protein